MKKILLVRVVQVDVPDDYEVPSVQTNMTHKGWDMEVDGHLYMSAMTGDMFVNVSVDNDLRPLSTEMRFLHWATISLSDLLDKNSSLFLQKTVLSIQIWVLDKVKYVIANLRRRGDRKVELRTGQVNMLKWDSEIFPKDRYWRSLN